MKKTTIISALALVAAATVPVYAGTTANGNDNSSVAQDRALAVNANVAADGGIANTSTGTVQSTTASTEAEKGGVANTSTGTVNAGSNNSTVEAEKGGVVANGAVSTESGNKSVEAERGGIVSGGAVTKESGNANDGSIVAGGPVNSSKAEEGGIAAAGDVKKVDISDSFNKQETEIKIGDVTVMVSTSDLSGEVENNRIDAGTNAALTSGNINNRGQAFSNTTGITVVKQNTGLNSQMQTSINVNANVTK